MTGPGPLPVIAALALFAAGAAGCAGTVVDPVKAREAIADDVQRKTGVGVGRVSCPSEVEVVPGDVFFCEVTAVDGRRARVGVRILNRDADVRLLGLEPVR